MNNIKEKLNFSSDINKAPNNLKIKEIFIKGLEVLDSRDFLIKPEGNSLAILGELDGSANIILKSIEQSVTEDKKRIIRPSTFYTDARVEFVYTSPEDNEVRIIDKMM